MVRSVDVVTQPLDEQFSAAWGATTDGFDRLQFLELLNQFLELHPVADQGHLPAKGSRAWREEEAARASSAVPQLQLLDRDPDPRRR